MSAAGAWCGATYLWSMAFLLPALSPVGGAARPFTARATTPSVGTCA